MIYTVEKANMISEQLKKFTTGYAHHVVGQFANIDFWLDEVNQAVRIIDEYNGRFNKMKSVQKEWSQKHKFVVFDYCYICRGKCEFGASKSPEPARTSSSEFKQCRLELVNAAYYFLTRCYRVGLLNEYELKEKCDFIGTGIDPKDLKK